MSALVNRMKVLSQEFNVRAYDPKGFWLQGHSRVLRNAPLLVYHPELATEVGFIQWNEQALYEPTPEEAKAKMAKEEIARKRLNAPIEPLNQAGKRDGRRPTLYANFAWGSGVKDMKTTAGSEKVRSMVRKLVRFHEDSYRADRAFFTNASAGVRGQMKVAMVDDGTVIQLKNGRKVVVKDGRGIVAGDVYDLAMSKAAFDIVNFGSSWSSGGPYITQRLSLNDALWAELLPLLEKGVVTLNSNHFLFTSSCDAATKRQFVEMDESKQMLYHPWIMRTVQQSKARAAYRLVTNGDMRMLGGVAVPVLGDELTLPSLRTLDGQDLTQEQEVIALRWPIDGWGSVRVTKVNHDATDIEEMNQMINVQYTLTNYLHDSFKGIATKIDRDLLPAEYADCDMIVGTEDRKLCADWESEADVKAAKVAQDFDFEDAVLVFVQVWGPGTAFGVPMGLQKSVNGDYDGDTLAVMATSDKPEMTRQIKAWPQDANPKIAKKKTLIESEDSSSAETARLSMLNGVGYATNVLSWTFATNDRAQLARMLNVDEPVLDARVGKSIKLFTDIFKAGGELAQPTMQYLQTVVQGLKDAGYMRPTYLTWLKSGAFFERLPKVGDIDTDGKDWDDWDKRNYIPADESKLGGTVADIIRWVLPQLSGICEMDPGAPLGHFKSWAMGPTNPAEYALAKLVINTYSQMVMSVNFQDEDSWESFMVTWRKFFGNLLASSEHNPAGISRERAVHCVWYEAHNDQRVSDLGPKGARVTASVAFVTDPEIAREIITHKPGLVPTETIKGMVIVGIQRQYPQAHDNMPLVRVRVENITWKNAFRQVLVAVDDLPGLIQPDSNLIPANTLAFVELRQQKLDNGIYWLRVRFNGKIWTADLNLVEEAEMVMA